MIDEDNRVIDFNSNNPIGFTNQIKWQYGIDSTTTARIRFDYQAEPLQKANGSPSHRTRSKPESDSRFVNGVSVIFFTKSM